MPTVKYRFHTLATLRCPGVLEIVYDRAAIMREASAEYRLSIADDVSGVSRQVKWACSLKAAWAKARGERHVVDVRRRRNLVTITGRAARELSTDGRL